jgi:hypothetical protein
VIGYLRTWDSTPPVELMHASNALAKLKKEEKRAKQEGRTLSNESGEDDEPETPAEVKTVLEMKAGFSVSSVRLPSC